MAKDQYGYPCEPRRIDDLSWFYELRQGIEIINEPIEGAKTTTIKLAWRKLEAAVDRRRRIKASKKRQR